MTNIIQQGSSLCSSLISPSLNPTIIDLRIIDLVSSPVLWEAETNKTLLPRDDVGRQYVSRKKEEEDLPAFKIATTHRYSYSKTAIKISEVKWVEKQLYGHFKQQTIEISHEKTWTWLRKGNFTQENLDRAKKVKSLERSWISFNNSKKQCHKDKLRKSKNRQDATK